MKILEVKVRCQRFEVEEFNAPRTDSIDGSSKRRCRCSGARPDAEATVDRMMKLVKHVDRLTEGTVSQFGFEHGRVPPAREAPISRPTAG